MKLLRNALVLGAAISALAALIIYLGIFDVAADVPHSAFTSSVIELVRDRSIAARSKDIQVPPLDDPKLIEEGAREYAEMCTGCHLAVELAGVSHTAMLERYRTQGNIDGHARTRPQQQNAVA